MLNAVAFAVISAVITLIGTCGNLLVIRAYIKKSHRQPSETLILSLGFIDFTCCIYYLLTNTVKAYTGADSPPYLFCLVDHFLQGFFPLASLIIMTVIAFNRFIAVVYPTKYSSFFTKFLVNILILAAMVFGIIQGSTMACVCNLVNDPKYPELYYMIMRYWAISTIFSFGLSLIFIAIFSLLAAIKLDAGIKRLKAWQNSDMDTNNPSVNEKSRVEKKSFAKDLKLTKALILIAVSYLILVSPYIVYSAGLRLHKQVLMYFGNTILHFKYPIFILNISNYVINPFTYFYLNEYFRETVTSLSVYKILFRRKETRDSAGNGEKITQVELLSKSENA